MRTAVICDATVFNQAGAYGVSVSEYQPTSLGAKQIEAIYGMIKYELNLREKWRA